VGTSGSGKTTLAGRAAEVLGIRHVEIDALYHGPDWTPRPSFVEDVRAFAETPAWVTEYQYRAVKPLLAGRADLLVWLDLPRSRVMRQVVGRTLRRRLRRIELWNGNLESSLWTFFTDRDHIVRWAWRMHAHTAERVAQLGIARPDLVAVRLHSRAETHAWLAGPLAEIAAHA